MSKKNKKKFKKKLNEHLQKVSTNTEKPLVNEISEVPKIENIVKTADLKIETKEDQINIRSDLKKFLILSLGLVAILIITVLAEKQTNFLLSIADKLFSALNIFQV